MLWKSIKLNSHFQNLLYSKFTNQALFHAILFDKIPSKVGFYYNTEVERKGY